MKNIVLLLLVVSPFQLIYAQEFNGSIFYQSLIKYVYEDPLPKSAVHILECKGNQSLFYQKTDTIWLPDKDIYCISSPEMIKKNYPQEGLLTYKNIIEKISCYYTEPIPNFDWEMLDGDSIICDYPCKKAQTTFRGRTWIVWYSEDLPYNDGPWKLCGLPGLILKATDVNKDFSFTAFKISKQVSPKEVQFSLKGYVKTTPQQYAKDMTLFRKDPWGFYEMRTGKRHGNVSFDDKPYTPPSETACLLEYFNEK
mgnify:FL=1